jgi:nucleobase:cation symporter-1, NCS1 family
VVDYYLVKRGHIDVESLYRAEDSSPYWYERGINRHAVLVFVVSAAVAAVIALVPTFSALAPFSWFVGAGLSGTLYWATARREERAVPEIAPRG